MYAFPLAADLLVIVMAMLLGVLHGRQLFRRGVRFSWKADGRQFPVLAAVGLLFIGINLVISIFQTYPRIWWHMPLYLDFYNIPVRWAFDTAVFAFLFSAVGALTFQQKHLLRWLLPVAAILVIGGGEYLIRHNIFVRPVEIGQPKISKDSVILQSSGATCAAASCANIARHYGLEKTERDMVELLGTTGDGTLPVQVYFGMQQLGFRCVKRRIPGSDFTQLHGPAILFVTIHFVPMAHAIAYIGQKDGLAEIWDPGFGKRFLNQAQLKASWEGYAIEVLPGNQ